MVIAMVQHLVAVIPPADGQDAQAVEISSIPSWARTLAMRFFGAVKILVVVWQIITQVSGFEYL